MDTVPQSHLLSTTPATRGHDRTAQTAIDHRLHSIPRRPLAQPELQWPAQLELAQPGLTWRKSPVHSLQLQ
jgi:hypothetical protein